MDILKAWSSAAKPTITKKASDAQVCGTIDLHSWCGPAATAYELARRDLREASADFPGQLPA